MESSYQARKIVERCLLVLLLASLGVGAYMQACSNLVQNLSAHANTPIEITLLTSPAMYVTYTPATRKAQVRVLSEKKRIKDPVERIKKSLELERITPPTPLKYFEPAQTKQELFWEDFKKTLSTWRYNPLKIARTLGALLSAKHQRRTNLSTAEIILLSLELTQLEANDFTVRFPTQKNKKQPVISPVKEDLARAPLAQQDRPIIVEILNASGKKGLALELTQYLREQNAKGLLRADVLQYDNYSTLEATSWIENYSGQPVALKQLGNAIGITGEIRAGVAGASICDTRIVLGKDFKMPL